jgi:hypothetical protein
MSLIIHKKVEIMVNLNIGFFRCKILKFLVIKTMEPDPELNPDPL